LQSKQLCALNRREEFRQLPLLVLNEIEPLALEHHRLVEQLRNAILICLVSRDNLLPQLASHFTLAHQKIAALLLELAIGSLQFLHLIVGELEPALHDFPGSHSQTLFEHLPTRVNRGCLPLWILRSSRSGCEHRGHRKSEN
jgi:hypothetical protein